MDAEQDSQLFNISQLLRLSIGAQKWFQELRHKSYLRVKAWHTGKPPQNWHIILETLWMEVDIYILLSKTQCFKFDDQHVVVSGHTLSTWRCTSNRCRAPRFAVPMVLGNIGSGDFVGRCRIPEPPFPRWPPWFQIPCESAFCKWNMIIYIISVYILHVHIFMELANIILNSGEFPIVVCFSELVWKKNKWEKPTNPKDIGNIGYPLVDSKCDLNTI